MPQKGHDLASGLGAPTIDSVWCHKTLGLLASGFLLAACSTSSVGSTPVNEVAETIPSPGASAESTPPRPPFRASARPLSRAERRMMTGKSWQPGCPVSLRDLRLLTISYTDFSGVTKSGQLVVNRDATQPVTRAFEIMYRARFPIQRMRLVDYYGADDMRSMAHNNTSAFNCRALPDSTTWSQHAYGTAVDINPVQNPYWAPDGHVEPTDAQGYLNRSRTAKGMIHEGDAAVRAFDRVGWGWGGRWNSPKDWQHFSASGR